MAHDIPLSVKAQTLLGALKRAGVDLCRKPGPQGNLWRALDAAAAGRMPEAALVHLQNRSEFTAEIEAISARFDATGEKSPVDLSFLLLGLFCASPNDFYELACELLAVIHARKDGRIAATPRDELRARESLELLA